MILRFEAPWGYEGVFELNLSECSVVMRSKSAFSAYVSWWARFTLREGGGF